MPVECPSCQWPISFEERGPAEDPSILLTGVMHFSPAAAVQIVGIRTPRASRRVPDYKDEVPRECYQENGLDEALESALQDIDVLSLDLSELVGTTRQGNMELPTGSYVLIALPMNG